MRRAARTVPARHDPPARHPRPGRRPRRCAVRDQSRDPRTRLAMTAAPTLHPQQAPDSGPEAPAIEVRDLEMTYGKGSTRVFALRSIQLTVARGEFVAIMGPSGSGKSTLLHILGALESPTSGTVAVGAAHYELIVDAALTRSRRDHNVFVFYFFHLLPSLSAFENALLLELIALM